MKKLIASLSAVFLLSSCTTYQTSEIVLPDRPIYVKLTAEQDASIPDDVYPILVKRFNQCDAYIDRVITILDQTN